MTLEYNRPQCILSSRQKNVIFVSLCDRKKFAKTFIVHIVLVFVSNIYSHVSCYLLL